MSYPDWAYGGEMVGCGDAVTVAVRRGCGSSAVRLLAAAARRERRGSVRELQLGIGRYCYRPSRSAADTVPLGSALLLLGSRPVTARRGCCSARPLTLTPTLLPSWPRG